MKINPLKLLRYSWVVLFFWFGIQQLIDPGAWTGFLPAWTGYLPIPGEMLVQLNAWFEIVTALFLLVGVFTRAVAGLLALHLFILALGFGGAIGMRDAVLSMIGVALAAAEPDSWTVDFIEKNKKTLTQSATQS